MMESQKESGVIQVAVSLLKALCPERLNDSTQEAEKNRIT